MEAEARASALRALDPLAGTWRLEASLAPGVGGTASFEWTLGRTFLVCRTSIPVGGAPASLSVIALRDDGEGFTMHYFDSRGVVRLYAMTIGDRSWTVLRRETGFRTLAFHQ